MLQGLPLSSHSSGGALRASACHAVVSSMLLEELHGGSEAFNVWQITLCQPGHYSRNGGCCVCVECSVENVEDRFETLSNCLVSAKTAGDC